MLHAEGRVTCADAVASTGRTALSPVPTRLQDEYRQSLAATPILALKRVLVKPGAPSSSAARGVVVYGPFAVAPQRPNPANCQPPTDRLKQPAGQSRGVAPASAHQPPTDRSAPAGIREFETVCSCSAGICARR